MHKRNLNSTVNSAGSGNISDGEIMTKRTIEKEGLNLTFTSFFDENPDKEPQKAEIAKELIAIVGEELHCFGPVDHAVPAAPRMACYLPGCQRPSG